MECRPSSMPDMSTSTFSNRQDRARRSPTFAVTGRGRQAPSPETLARFLERQAREAPTADEAENMTRAANYVRGLTGSVFRAAAVGALSHAARIALGFG
jgi:hypothetical protein